jgi:hypothetical protein
VIYHWEVVLESGEKADSGPLYYDYDDINHTWQVLQNQEIAVYWHDYSWGFGTEVYDVATRAVASQKQLFQHELDYRIRLFIYNSNEEFAAWHYDMGEFVGGEAYPIYGITVQIVPDENYGPWLNEVIPHEIAHLYFHQVTDHPFSEPPLWLNEGVAQYNELRNYRVDLAYAKNQILEGNAIPLIKISVRFDDSDEEMFRLAYAESLSAVVYMIETYGIEGLSALLSAYRAGTDTQSAFQLVFGRSTLEFEQDWYDWLGVPDELYATPTPTLTLTPTPTPTLTFTPQPKATASPTATKTPVISSTPTAEQAVDLAPAGGVFGINMGITAVGFCLAGLGVFLVVVVLFLSWYLFIRQKNV